MAQIYDPNQAGAFNKLLQSGLSTANAAVQAGISSAAASQYGLGNNGNLGALIPGANAAPATAQSTFQNVDFAQTVSGQPVQTAQLNIAPAQLDTPQTIVLTTPTVTGLDLTATSPFAAFDQVQAVPRPTLAAEAAPSPTTFSATDPRVSSSIPNPVIVTTSDAARDAAISASRPGYDQAPPVTDTNIAGGIRPQDVGPANSAPAPQLVPTQTLDPATAQQALTPAAEPVNANTAGLPIRNEEGQVVQGILQNPETGETYYTTAPAPVPSPENPSAENQSNAETARLNNANQQAAIQSTYKQPGNVEWRFRISLAEGADYLYKAGGGAGSPSASGGFSGAQFGNTGAGPGILAPLIGTNGVVFPYTPQVQMTYRAKYNSYELVHSNYRGAFYQNSSVDDISIRGTFTAQDTYEAAYMLAVIHFFRSVTKMFYGQDKQRGAPPPLVYLSGLGDYQFNNHPAVITSFDYSLPADVDYIRANQPNNFGTDLLNRRTSYAAPPSNPLSAIANRLAKAFLSPGAEPQVPDPQPVTNSVTNTATATYVPTKIEISLNLMPMQTRDQVSKQFSLAKFADGNLLRGGFW